MLGGDQFRTYLWGHVGADGRFRLSPEKKQAWTEALRSGKYDQGYGSLALIDSHGNESFCCLGVLCDLDGGFWTRNEGQAAWQYHLNEDHDGIGNYAPGAGIPQVVQGVLAKANDEGVKFSEIADWIEKNL